MLEVRQCKGGPLSCFDENLVLMDSVQINSIKTLLTITVVVFKLTFVFQK